LRSSSLSDIGPSTDTVGVDKRNARIVRRTATH
jgi:hypothetical protein